MLFTLDLIKSRLFRRSFPPHTAGTTQPTELPLWTFNFLFLIFHRFLFHLLFSLIFWFDLVLPIPVVFERALNICVSYRPGGVFRGGYDVQSAASVSQGYPLGSGSRGSANHTGHSCLQESEFRGIRCWHTVRHLIIDSYQFNIFH